jgi:hypothetical protein
MSKRIPSIEQIRAISEAAKPLRLAASWKWDGEDSRAYEKRCSLRLGELVEAIRPVRALLDHVEGWQDGPEFKSTLRSFLEAFDTALPEWPNNGDQRHELDVATGRLSRCMPKPDQPTVDPGIKLDWHRDLNGQTQQPNDGDGGTPPRPVGDSVKGTPEDSQPTVARLTFDLGDWTVVFDGKEYKINNARAFKIFKVIADANGELVSTEMIRAKVSNCGIRIDKILGDHVPAPLRSLAKGHSGPNSGYALKLPKKSVRNGAR